jgi:hypothetical protein
MRVLGGGLPVVEGSIGGQKVNLFVDTGTTPPIVDQALAQSLGLRLLPGSHLQLLGGTRAASWTWLPDVRIGPAHQQAVPAKVSDLSYLKRKYGVSIGAIVGFDVLGDTSFRLDYEARTMTFEDVGADGIAVPLVEDSPFAVATVEFARQKLRLLVDTGATGLVLFRPHSDRGMLGDEALKPTSVENLGGRVSAWGAAAGRHADLRVQGTPLQTGSVFLVAKGDDFKEFDGLLSVRSLGFRALCYDRETRTVYLQF